jgi:hypothetical protein
MRDRQSLGRVAADHLTRLSTIAVVVLLLWPLVASAEMQWRLDTRNGRPYLELRDRGEEADTDFWASCRKPGDVVDIGILANTGVGKGRGEPVTLQLVGAAARIATLQGVSRRSAYYQMTAGTELRATVTFGDPLFAILAAGGPVEVTGSIARPLTLDVRGLATKLDAFMRACGS